MPRQYCKFCNKVQEACYCKLVPRFSIDAQIIILQHPSEVGHALGTAQIVALSLTENCKILVGENFETNSILQEAMKTTKCFLVFPITNQNQVPLESPDHDKKTFILLDGTWKKAKKIYFKNPILQSLPHIELKTGQNSRYYLRKVPKANCLSTLEAVVAIVQQECSNDISETLKVLDYIQDFQKSKFVSNNGSFYYSGLNPKS